MRLEDEGKEPFRMRPLWNKETKYGFDGTFGQEKAKKLLSIQPSMIIAVYIRYYVPLQKDQFYNLN